MSNPPDFDPETGEAIGTGGTSPQPQARADATGDDDAPSAFQPMSLDDARATMVRVHGVAVGKDDPILMTVTLHQGFVADLEKLLDRHIRHTQAMLAATGNGYAEAVERTLESLKEKTVQASIEHALALMAEFTKASETLRRRMRRFGIYQTVLALATVIGCVLTLAVLIPALR